MWGCALELFGDGLGAEEVGIGGAGPVGGGLATLALELLATPLVVELAPFMLETISSSLTSVTVSFVLGPFWVQEIQDVSDRDVETAGFRSGNSDDSRWWIGARRAT